MLLRNLSICLVLCLALGRACAFSPAASLDPALQAQLDRAVLDHDAGKLAAARTAFTALARRHVPAAEYNLAVMHLRREMPRPSRAAARQLLERAAGAGFITAQLMLGRVLESGELGMRDLKTAHQWYALAAEAGDVEAEVAMGTAHYLGRGMPKDPARAAHWFREAANGGDLGAMYLLASMYEQGDGVHKDLRLARYWYEAAARAGDEIAPGKVKEMDIKLAAQPA